MNLVSAGAIEILMSNIFALHVSYLLKQKLLEV